VAGQPGTRKTYALRALARAWRDWCDFHVVVDPDIFFGEDSSYLMDILFLEPRRNSQGEPKARLLVLEDARRARGCGRQSRNRSSALAVAECE